MKKPENPHETPDTEVFAAHFKRSLVPLDEYAARQGVSSDVVETQGQLGVIQIRKFRGQKFVVDVPPEQLSDFESNIDEKITAQAIKPQTTAASKFITAGLITISIIVVITVFWLYMDAQTKLDDLRAEHASIRSLYDNLSASNENISSIQQELASSKVELAQIRSKIASSRSELERVQTDLNRARRNLDTVQSQLSGIQGQISLSRVEIESIQNGLNQSKNDLDDLNTKNTEPNVTAQPQ